MKRLKKYICSILAVVFILTMLSGVCYANDGMPVLTFDKSSYEGSADGSVTVTGSVTDPGNSSPMKGVTVSFTLKDGNGNETSLGTQTSDANGKVTCNVTLGSAFPYTISGSASDGVNVTTATITAGSSEPVPTVEEPTVDTTDLESAATTTETTSSSNSTMWIIILIIVVIIAAVVIIVVVSKKKKK